MKRHPLDVSVLRDKGVDVFERNQDKIIRLPEDTEIECPAGIKWTELDHSFRMGAFSYQVSGFCFATRIGRYCSIGENVQIGRQNHPLSWVSTSPFFYFYQQCLNVGNNFSGADAFHKFRFTFKGSPTRIAFTQIHHDVWIGHGAYIKAGVTIETGAVIAASSVVTKNVPAYAVVAGNPAVIKKYRVPPEWISPLLRSRWWRFAPWQLTHLDPSHLQRFVTGVFEMQSEPEFEPTIVRVKDLMK